MATMIGLVLVFMKLTAGDPDCRYIQYWTDNLNPFGPLYPVDVCMKLRQVDPNDNTQIIDSSYQFVCGLLGATVREYYYPNSADCSNGPIYSKIVAVGEEAHCNSRKICDHVTFRMYAQAQDECKPDDDNLYQELAFVTGCWNADGNQRSGYVENI